MGTWVECASSALTYDNASRSHNQFTSDLVSETGLALQYPFEADDEACCHDSGERACGVTSECGCVAVTGEPYIADARCRTSIYISC